MFVMDDIVLSTPVELSIFKIFTMDDIMLCMLVWAIYFKMFIMDDIVLCTQVGLSALKYLQWMRLYILECLLSLEMFIMDDTIYFRMFIIS